MRCFKYLVVLTVLALMIPLNAIALPKNERRVTIPDAMVLGSTQLKPGTYIVEWHGNGPVLSVSFLNNHKTIVTTQAKMVEKNINPLDDEFVTRITGKTRRLEEIHFGGKKDALVFASNQTPKK
jgi:hypothetical protein